MNSWIVPPLCPFSTTTTPFSDGWVVPRNHRGYLDIHSLVTSVPSGNWINWEFHLFQPGLKATPLAPSGTARTRAANGGPCFSMGSKITTSTCRRVQKRGRLSCRWRVRRVDLWPKNGEKPWDLAKNMWNDLRLWHFGLPICPLQSLQVHSWPLESSATSCCSSSLVLCWKIPFFSVPHGRQRDGKKIDTVDGDQSTCKYQLALSQAQKLNSKLDGLTAKNGRRIRCDATLQYLFHYRFCSIQLMRLMLL